MFIPPQEGHQRVGVASIYKISISILLLTMLFLLTLPAWVDILDQPTPEQRYSHNEEK